MLATSIASAAMTRNRTLRPHSPKASDGGEGGIRTHVPLTRQDAFEAPPLRPLRYLSAEVYVFRTIDYTWGPGA